MTHFWRSLGFLNSFWKLIYFTLFRISLIQPLKSVAETAFADNRKFIAEGGELQYNQTAKAKILNLPFDLGFLN